MSVKIEFKGATYHLDIPSECPLCFHHVVISEIFGKNYNLVARDIIKGQKSYFAQVPYRCVNLKCGELFITEYILSNTRFERVYSFPQNVNLNFFSETTRKISPSFILIYYQSEKAKSLHLGEVCGPGYRKAFERLIKDYAISKFPDKAEEIKKQFVGNVVRDFVKDGKINAVAKRALWLGNDESHYTRKWLDKDIDDLILLIKLTDQWIDSEAVTKEYIDSMPET